MLSQNPKMMLAKAVFDNDGETSEELSFQRGDLLNVIQINPNGLDGWWLCSLNGQVGIAPGNRLKEIIDKQGDNSSDLDILKKNNHRTSSAEPNKVVTPKRIGEVFKFESSAPPMADYDVPKPGTNVLKNDKLMTSGSLYDSPRSIAANVKVIEDTYDTPSSHRHKTLVSHFEQLKVEDGSPGSNRSSGISVLSGVSGTSNHSVLSHSSLDTSRDFYDVPPTSKTREDDSRETCNSSESRPRPRPGETWGGDYCEIHERQGSDRQREDGGDLSMYDSPKSTVKKADGEMTTSVSSERLSSYQKTDPKDRGGIYDIPPQVTKDFSMLPPTGTSPSGIDTLSNSSNDSKSSGTDTTPVHDELLLEINAAMERLAILQQNLVKYASKLLGFVHSSWRKREQLESSLFDVKINCGAVQEALQGYTEFSQGAAANASKLHTKNVYRKLSEHLQPIQEATNTVNEANKALTDIKWDVNKLSTDLVDSTILDDDLNRIVSASKQCLEDSKTLTAFMQGNARLLFHGNEVISPKPLVKGYKPPGKTAPPVKQKPNLHQGVTNSCSDKVQDRPLPTPPTQRRETRASLNEQQHSTVERRSAGQPIQVAGAHLDQTLNRPGVGYPTINQGQDYDIPKTRQEIEDLKQQAERRRLTEMNDSLTNNNKSSSSSTDDYDNSRAPINYSEVSAPTEEEYDYVALTPDQVKNSLAFKYFQEGSVSRLPINPDDVVKSPATDRRTEPASRELPKYPCMYDSPASLRGVDTPASINSNTYDSPSTARNMGGSVNVSVSVGENTYDSPGDNRSVDVYDSPQNNSVVSRRDQLAMSGSSFDLDMSGQLDGMQVPNVRTSGLSAKFREKIEKLQQEAEANVVSHDSLGLQQHGDLQNQRKSQVSNMDKQVLGFYAAQIKSQITVLEHAMEALFQAVDYNQPPKVFIAHSKFVILAAHKLVYIGDTISRNVVNEGVRHGVMMCANQLCDMLKATVTATKRAALEYPSIGATQEMVNKVYEIDTAAKGLKTVIAYNAVL